MGLKFAFRRVAWLVFAALLGLPLAGCATSAPEANAITPFPGAAAPTQTAAGYTLDTPIERIAADPRGRAVLNQDLPDLLSNPNYNLFKGMSLKSVASFSHGKLSEEKLARTAADLAALPKEAALGE